MSFLSLKLIYYRQYMNTCPYDLLNVTRNATEDEIKRSFRKLSSKCHPDRVSADDPDRELKTKQFIDLNEAKETLLNPQTRRAYDMGGWDMVKHVSESIRAREQQKLKCEPLVVQREISINELYHNKTIKLEVDVPIHGEDGSVEVVKFPMEFQAESLGKIVAPNEGTQKPGRIPGDIIVIAELERNCPFDIKGLDLIYTAKLNLLDLFQGYKVIVPHPTGPLLVKGQYTFRDNENDNLLIFPGLGLGHGRGNLVLHTVADLSSLDQLPQKVKQDICMILNKEFGSEPSIPDSVTDITSSGKTPQEMRKNMPRIGQMFSGLIPGVTEVIEGGSMGDSANCRMQ